MRSSVFARPGRGGLALRPVSQRRRTPGRTAAWSPRAAPRPRNRPRGRSVRTADERAGRGQRRRGLRIDPDCDSHAGGGASAQAGESAASGRGDARADRARCRKLKDSDIATAPIGEARVATHHTATIGGRPIAYTATAGTLTLRDDDGKPTASMFYVAYTTGDAATGR